MRRPPFAVSIAVVGALVLVAACSGGSQAGNPRPCSGDGCGGTGGGDAGGGGTGGVGPGGGGGIGGSGGTGGAGGTGGVGGTGGAGGTGGVPVTCGDGAVDEGEACDDGNREPGDGCSAGCTVERECWWDLDCPTDGTVCSGRQGQRGFCVPAPGACATHLECPAIDPVRCPDTEACLCAGVCLRRLPGCEPCTSHHACGEDDTFLNPGRCVEHSIAYGDIVREERVCLHLPGPHGECPPGETIGGSGYCELPFCRAGQYCEQDADCGSRVPCDLATFRCIRDSCLVPWPWAEGGWGCGEKGVCVAPPDSFDPTRLADCSTAWYYGGLGRCSVACAGDEECAYLADPWGNPYVCRPSGATYGCRPAGCLHDSECPAPAGTTGAFCDPVAMACVEGPCRLGLDPREGCSTDVPYDDCAPGYECVPAASGDSLGTCVAR